MEKLTVHLKYICSLKILRLGRSLHACPFQPAVFSPSIYPWPGSAEPRVKLRQTVTKLPVAPGQLHKFHTPCLQARTRMLDKEAKGFTQSWQNMQLYETLCNRVTFGSTWETEQNKELDIYKLLCWHFTIVFGFSSHCLDPNQRCSICCNHPAQYIKTSLRAALPHPFLLCPITGANQFLIHSNQMIFLQQNPQILQVKCSSSNSNFASTPRRPGGR